MQHLKFPSIESLQSVAKLAQKRGIIGPQRYVAKIKLHGTNAGIQISPDGTVTAQSRSRIITPEDDNYGFAHYVEHNRESFAKLATDQTLCIFGEWCGQGIQKNTALSQLPGRIFAPFAYALGDEFFFEPRNFPCSWTIPLFNDGEVFEIDFYGDNTETLAKINAHVANIEACDPFTLDNFSIGGPGEGLVFYPINLPFAEFAFKAKGEAHRTVSSTKAAQMEAPEFRAAIEFAHGVLTPARLEQALTETGEKCLPNIGAFLKWIAQDVRKECMPELEASKLPPTHAMNAVQKVAKAWYLK